MKLAMRAWAWAAAVAVLIAATSSSASSEPASEPTVLLEKGRVRGVAMTSEGGRMYTAFKGLPYARPPVGKYRFREPKAAKPWQGVWDGARLPPKCLQFERFPVSDVLGDEDCLYLSVFTPRLPETGAPLMDVLVWIHGGGFMYGGSSEYGAEFIMDHDIVLVNINYRLGPLGFLSTEDDVVPGNNGLKDQAMALRWVQANIAAFGGNPNSVTLLGLSAGGASVHYQYLSPLTKGLFHRGWSMSGSALCPWTLQEAARAKAHRLAELTGCPSGANVTSRDLVECLRHRPARALVSAVPRMQDALHLPFSVFAPVVEPAGTPGAFLELPPAQVVRDGLAHDLPWITGITSEEGLYNAAEFLGPANADRLQTLEGSGWLEKAPLLLDYAYTVSDATQRDALSAAVRKLYLGQRSLAEAPKEFIAMIGDRIFNAGVEWAAREMAAVNTQPVFLYEFAFRGLASLSTYMSGGDATDWGVSHGDDAAYIFKWIAVDLGKTANERKVSKQLLSILSSFARTGVPSALPGSPAWPPLEPKATDLRILRVNKNAELSVDNVPEFGQSSFWASQPLAEQQPLNTLSSSRDEL